MRLNKIPFEQIKNGIKTIELRLNDEKRRSLSIGDDVTFVSVESSNEIIKTTIVALHKFSSFEALFSTPLYEKCGFGKMTKAQAVECMRSYYTEEQEQKYGALGIELQLI